MDAEGQETVQPKRFDDGFIALVILVIAAIVGVILLINYFRASNNTKGTGWQANNGGFTPPPERAAYIEAKNQAKDLSNLAEVDELKKLLMKRALKAIPLVLSLQTEGSSIERLYKKGMLTDDMHFKVKELKTFVDAEFQEVQQEAEELVEGWGQAIWPQAMQFHQMIQKQGEGKLGNGKEESVVEEKKKEIQKPKKENKKAESKEVVKEVLPTSDEAKALEAERNAQKLLEEEEREKQKQGKKSGKGSNNKPKKS